MKTEQEVLDSIEGYKNSIKFMKEEDQGKVTFQEPPLYSKAIWICERLIKELEWVLNVKGDHNELG